MYDILIIGSGGAGLTSAIELSKSSKSIVVLSKTFPTASQTAQAQGGINAVISDNGDSIENHINDTIKSSHSLGDEDTIKYMCENGKETIKWLDDIGVPFSKDKDNNIAQRKLGGTTNPRACYSSDYTGLKILHTLYDNAIKNNITFLNEYMLLDFIIVDNCVKGVVALDIKNSEVKQILAKEVIVASGGYAGIYHKYTTNSTATTGEVLSASYRAGCKLSNMEYVQFHPTALRDSSILISESARGEGGYLVTKDGERFTNELGTRDIVARAIFNKIEQGEDVFLDLRHIEKDKILESMPQEYNLAFESMGLELDKDLIPIKPVAHYTMGGIKTDIYGRTNIENLYAIGEVSSNGVHGANRLGGNSLLEIITFGRAVANKIMEDDKNIYIDNKEYDIFLENKEFVSSLYELPTELNFYDYKENIGEMFYSKVGLFRDGSSLQSVISNLDYIKDKIGQMGISDKSYNYNTNLKEFIEFINSIELGKVIVSSALQREESRGSHYRIDFLDEDKSFAKEIVVELELL
ncbi:MAG: FAD-dependent oxidoreductase [Campylobacterota bacterium]|nr:FAD-dependent oxidoreductase [Campylobacterota bacterium]